MTADWRVELTAARLPATDEQDAWDRRFQPRYDRYRADGRTPAEASRIAWRLTEEQHGQRPKITEEA